MKVILVFVATLDGKITKWGHPHVRTWSSREDQSYFSKLMKSSKLVVMGSNTYNTDPVFPVPGKLTVVMTHSPEKYQDKQVPGSVVFTTQSPAEIVKQYTDDGFEEMIMVGGPHAATSFLKDRLIHEIWLTIEPQVFGTGGNFVISENLDIQLKLLSYQKINQQGSMIMKYEVTSN